MQDEEITPFEGDDTALRALLSDSKSPIQVDAYITGLGNLSDGATRKCEKTTTCIQCTTENGVGVLVKVKCTSSDGQVDEWEYCKT